MIVVNIVCFRKRTFHRVVIVIVIIVIIYFRKFFVVIICQNCTNYRVVDLTILKIKLIVHFFAFCQCVFEYFDEFNDYDARASKNVKKNCVMSRDIIEIIRR